MENIPDSDAERATRIKDLFTRAGCGKLVHDQHVEGEDLPNVICQLHGQDSGTVIVGAHYDRSTVERPIDDWSAAALLPALYQSLHSRSRHHTYVFVAFADHGEELIGSTFFAAHLSSSGAANAEAMVNLDALGLSPTKVSPTGSDKELVHDLLTMVYSLKLPASQIDLKAGSITDAEPFAARRIPCITIHSLTQPNIAERATTRFRPESYYDSYRLISGYLAYLDAILKQRPN
jgi:hypothetical protein